MKVLIMGDPHFKRDNLEIMKIYCQEIFEMIDTYKPDIFVCLGDVLDTHERGYIKAVSDSHKFFNELSEILPVYILIGNHDRQNNLDFMTDIHFFNGLKGKPNIHVIDSTLWDKDLNMIFVPYVPPGRFMEALKYAEWSPNSPNQPIVGFAHQEFYGAKNGSFVSEIGDNWSTNYFPLYSGHYHEYHRLPCNVVYVGTIQTAYGESDDNALMLLTINDTNITEKRIKITSVPKKVVITYKYKSNLEEELLDFLNENNKVFLDDMKQVKVKFKIFRKHKDILFTNNTFKEIKQKCNTYTFEYLDILEVKQHKMPEYSNSKIKDIVHSELQKRQDIYDFCIKEKLM